jgi:hypothetical protein
MSTFRKAAKAMFGVAVAGALAFGATEARATARTTCTINYEYGSIGSCSSETTCDQRCKSIYGPESGGACLGGCCRCAI